MGFDSRLEAHYIIKLEGQIKALERPNKGIRRKAKSTTALDSSSEMS